MALAPSSSSGGGGAPAGAASGDLSGTYPAPTVSKVNGVAVTGAPSVGYVPTATGASAAVWAANGGSLSVTDGSTPVANVTEILFVGAVTGDNGDGTVEVDIAPGLADVLDTSSDGGGNGMTNTGQIASGGAEIGTEGGDLSTDGGDLNLGTGGKVASDLVMATAKKIVVAGGIDIATGGAVFLNTDQTGVAVDAASIHAALVNLGLITA